MLGTWNVGCWCVLVLGVGAISCGKNSGDGTAPGSGGATTGTGGTVTVAGTGGGSTSTTIPAGSGGATVPSGTGGGLAGTTGYGGQSGIDAGATGGSVAAGNCATDLSGTWDLIATSKFGNPSAGMLVIGPDTFSVTVATERWWADSPSTKTLAYSAAGSKTLTWTRTGDPDVPIAVQNTPSNLSAGSIPLALGGQWTFSANRVLCSASIDSTSTIACQSNPSGTQVGGTWPFPIPFPRPNTIYNIARKSQLDSQFGFLGGDWQARSSSTSEACTMKVEGATVSINCTTSNSLKGSMQMTVGAGCVASGTTSTGWELSARRR